jgi:hypothetical protein
MPDDTEAAVLRARLETIIKEAKDVEAQVAAARRRVQDARLLLVEEASKATAMEQTATVCPSTRAIFSFLGVFPGRGPAARPHRLFDL